MAKFKFDAKRRARSGIRVANGTACTVTQEGMAGIQNLSTTPLFVKFGAGASATDFDIILAAGSAADDGKGAYAEFVHYVGYITVFSATPRYVAWGC